MVFHFDVVQTLLQMIQHEGDLIAGTRLFLAVKLHLERMSDLTWIGHHLLLSVQNVDIAHVRMVRVDVD